MIHTENWHREAETMEQALSSLRRKVEERDESAVVPYVQLLERMGKLGGPHPELHWLGEKTQGLRREILRPYHDYLYVGSLLGPTDYNDRTNLSRMYYLIERAVRVTEDVIEGKSHWGGPATFSPDVVAELIDFSQRLPEIKTTFAMAIHDALEKRDAHPKAQEFVDQLEEEIEWAREKIRNLEQFETWYDQITNSDISPEAYDEFDPDAPDELSDENVAAEELSQAWSAFDYLGELLHSYLSSLFTLGYPDPSDGFYGPLSQDGHFIYQWDEMEANFYNGVHWIQSEHPGELQEIME